MTPLSAAFLIALVAAAESISVNLPDQQASTGDLHSRQENDLQGAESFFPFSHFHVAPYIYEHPIHHHLDHIDHYYHHYLPHAFHHFGHHFW
ncbi:UNVERIFIED_CONTAM: hypothetical protein PYX00_000778 [Menopon gallinae]|uniref:Uncharacterized protein n=1 Tax=Menopon gallinae TaxID=328185 RepID=A0AAW2IAH3_9NEOP